MFVALVVMTLFFLWRVTKTLRQTSTTDDEYRARLRRTLYQFAGWAGVGLAIVTGHVFMTAPDPNNFLLSWLLSAAVAYAVLLALCAGFYTLAKRY